MEAPQTGSGPAQRESLEPGLLETSVCTGQCPPFEREQACRPHWVGDSMRAFLASAFVIMNPEEPFNSGWAGGPLFFGSAVWAGS